MSELNFEQRQNSIEERRKAIQQQKNAVLQGVQPRAPVVTRRSVSPEEPDDTGSVRVNATPKADPNDIEEGNLFLHGIISATQSALEGIKHADDLGDIMPFGVGSSIPLPDFGLAEAALPTVTEAAADVESSMNRHTRESMNQDWFQKDDDALFGYSLNPDVDLDAVYATVIHGAGSSVPTIVAAGGPGGVVKKGAEDGVEWVAKKLSSKTQNLISKGVKPRDAVDRVLSNTWLNPRKAAGTAAQAVVGASAVALTEGGSTASEVENSLMQQPLGWFQSEDAPEEVREAFSEAYHFHTDESASPQERLNQAKVLTAEDRAQVAFENTAPEYASVGLFTALPLLKAVTGKVPGKVSSIATAGAAEATEEGVAGYRTQQEVNLATGRPENEGAVHAALEGGAKGAAAGAGMATPAAGYKAIAGDPQAEAARIREEQDAARLDEVNRARAKQNMAPMKSIKQIKERFSVLPTEDAFVVYDSGLNKVVKTETDESKAHRFANAKNLENNLDPTTEDEVADTPETAPTEEIPSENTDPQIMSSAEVIAKAQERMAQRRGDTRQQEQASQRAQEQEEYTRSLQDQDFGVMEGASEVLTPTDAGGATASQAHSTGRDHAPSESDLNQAHLGVSNKSVRDGLAEDRATNRRIEAGMGTPEELAARAGTPQLEHKAEDTNVVVFRDGSTMPAWQLMDTIKALQTAGDKAGLRQLQEQLVGYKLLPAEEGEQEAQGNTEATPQDATPEPEVAETPEPLVYLKVSGGAYTSEKQAKQGIRRRAGFGEDTHQAVETEGGWGITEKASAPVEETPTPEQVASPTPEPEVVETPAPLVYLKASGSAYVSEKQAEQGIRRREGFSDDTHRVVETDGGWGITEKSMDEKANNAATSPTNDRPEPTEGQKSSGNYKVGKVKVHGLNVSIENPKGSVRRGKDANGNAWEIELQNHYGYFKSTVGKDKDHVDAFIGENAEDPSLSVFIVDQVNAKGKFDEHKVVLGAANEAEAREMYLSNYAQGWTGLGSITEMSVADFKVWVKDKKKTQKPAHKVHPPGRLKKLARDIEDGENGVEFEYTDDGGVVLMGVDPEMGRQLLNAMDENLIDTGVDDEGFVFDALSSTFGESDISGEYDALDPEAPLNFSFAGQSDTTPEVSTEDKIRRRKAATDLRGYVESILSNHNVKPNFTLNP
jgi:hypothetical protein